MWKRNFIGLFLILGLLGGGFALDAYAGGVVTVCNRFGSELEEGTLSWALAGGGTVTFNCNGTIIVAPEIRIEADTRIDATGRNVVLSGGNANSVFWIWAEKKLDLIGLTITKGAVYGGVRNIGGTVTLNNCVISGSTSMYGSGIRNENWSPTSSVGIMTLTNTIVSDNTADFGAGIYNAGNMTLTDSTVTRNSATNNFGGGILNHTDGSLTLINSIVSDNTAVGHGGGIYNNGGELILRNSIVSGNTSETHSGGGISYCCEPNGATTIIDSVISDNTAESCGGIHGYGGIYTIENSTVSNNHARDVGGGICSTVDAEFTITNSTISGNSAAATDRGGGIFSSGGPMTITNSTLSGNSASQGGGIYNYAPLTLTHVTFCGNSASEGSNLYVVNHASVTAQITNTLIANGLMSSNCGGNIDYITDGGYNLDDDDTCNLTSLTSLPNTNPLLDGVLANNGGLTETHALLEDSPAIDCIPSGINGCGGNITTDQRGIVRPQGDGCDIGAYELVLVSGNQAPTADAGPDQTVEQASYAGTEVTLDGSGSTDPDSTPGTNDDIVSFDWYEGDDFLGSGEVIDYTFPLGTRTLTLKVTDSYDETDEDEVVVTIEDTSPPELSMSVGKNSLWPPNHKMVDVGFGFEVSDICDPEPDVSVQITSDEPTATAPGAGGPKYAPDAEIIDDGMVLLRSERSGKGDGRVYVITVTATDASGNSSSASSSVKVNHSKKKEAVDSGQYYDATEIN